MAQPSRADVAQRGVFLAAMLAAAVASAAEAAPPTVSVHRVLAMLVEVPGRRPLQATRAQVAKALYGSHDSAASQLRNISYGQVNFPGSIQDVVGPFTVAEPGDFCQSGYLRLADAADAAARKSGVDLAGYDHFVYLIPPDMPCSWVGVGLIGGRRVWAKAATARLFRHELGHNLGLDHALLWSKASAEGSDLMGDSSTGLNAPHLVHLGWLAAFPGKRIDVRSGRTLTLEPLEADPTASDLPMVAVVKPSAAANTYYLSYRALPLGQQFTRGVNIHIFNDSRGDPPYTYFVKSLADGESYTDGPLIIRQLSHVPGEQVRVRIEFTGRGAAMSAGPPPPPPGSFQSVATGLCLDVSRGSRSDGAAVIQYGCHGGLNQQWTLQPGDGELFQIVNKGSGKCLTVRPGAVVSGAPLVQWSCASRTDQLWRLQGEGGDRALEVAGSALCVDVPRGSHESGLPIALWECSGAANQKWSLSAASPASSDQIAGDGL